MKAIETKYFGPGNVKGARIKASAEGGNSLTIAYPYELDAPAGHRLAAEGLCEKMGWEGKLIGGGTKAGYVFVFAHSNI